MSDAGPVHPERVDDAPMETRPTVRTVFYRLPVGKRVRGVLWSVLYHFAFRWCPVNWCRRMLLRMFGATIGRRAHIARTARVSYPWNLTVGREARIQHSVILNCMGEVVVGPGTLVSQYAHVCGATHEFEDPEMHAAPRKITIGKNVWIAADAFVGPGVTIGDGCLLAARSSAFHDLPGGKVCIGEPATPRYDRFGRDDEQADGG
jgi:putative colanic acid biosynthesis acetyltransferase WcaF